MVRDLALDAQLVTSILSAGVTSWRIDADLIKWIELIRHGIQSRRFAIAVQTVVSQQRAA
jgi:hypothetical protein